MHVKTLDNILRWLSMPVFIAFFFFFLNHDRQIVTTNDILAMSMDVQRNIHIYTVTTI